MEWQNRLPINSLQFFKAILKFASIAGRALQAYTPVYIMST